jgi:hypothetical protein
MSLPYIVATKVAYTNGTSAASITFDDWFTGQQTGDWFMLIAHNDTGTTALGVSGWTEQISAAPNNSSSRCGVWAVRHTGSTITVPTVTGTSAAWRVLALHIRGAGSTLLDAASARTNQTASTQSLTLPSITTTNNNCLIIRVIGMDGSGFSNWDKIAESCVNIDRGSDTDGSLGACELQVWYENARTSGAVPARTLTRGVSDGGTLYTLAIIGSVSGAAMPEIEAPTITTHYNGAHAVPTWNDISTIRTTLNGTTVGTCTPTPSISGNTATPEQHGSVHVISVVPVTTSGVIIGAYTALPSNADLTQGIFSLMARSNSSASFGTEGVGLYFEDNVGQWKTLMVYPKGLGLTFYSYFGYVTAETFTDTSAGSIDWTNISRIGLFYRKISAGTTAQTLAIGRVCNINGAFKISGGSATNPITPAFIANALIGQSLYGAALVQAGSQAAVCVPLTIGNTAASYYKAQGQALAIPAAGTAGFKVYRLAAQDMTLTYKAASGDTISNTGSVFAPAVLQNITFDSATSASATYDLGGVVATSAVTLATNAAVVGATFTDCTKITGKGCAVTECRILATRASDAAISFDTSGASIVGTTIDITGKTVDYHVELGTSVTAFDATDAVFTGTAQVNQIHVLKTTGTVTITLALGQTEPTYTSSGATVVFDQPILATTWTNPDLADGTTILVRNIDTSTTIAYVASLATGTGYSITLVPGVDYTPGDEIQVRQSRKNGTTYYVERTSRIITSAGGGTITEADALSQCSICTAFALDGEDYDAKFDIDYVDDELDIDVTGTWQTAQLMVWWKWQMTVQTAMESFWGAWSVESDGSFKNNVDTLSSVLDNTTATDCVETSRRRVRRSDGARPIKANRLIDVSWSEPVTVVSTGSGVQPGDITAIGAEVASRSQAGELHADVRWVNDVSVTGTGQTGDEWGPA